MFKMGIEMFKNKHNTCDLNSILAWMFEFFGFKEASLLSENFFNFVEVEVNTNKTIM